MKNKTLFRSIFMLILLGSILILPGCNKTEYVTVTNTKTITTTKDSTIMFDGSLLNESGIIQIKGIGDFCYQQAYINDSENIVYQGVTFEFVSYEKNVNKGEIIYSILAKFEDGTNEQLEYTGYTSDFDINIYITSHDNPYAGIFLLCDNIGETFVYLLVSVED